MSAIFEPHPRTVEPHVMVPHQGPERHVMIPYGGQPPVSATTEELMQEAGFLQEDPTPEPIAQPVRPLQLTEEPEPDTEPQPPRLSYAELLAENERLNRERWMAIESYENSHNEVRELTELVQTLRGTLELLEAQLRVAQDEAYRRPRPVEPYVRPWQQPNPNNPGPRWIAGVPNERPLYAVADGGGPVLGDTSGLARLDVRNEEAPQSLGQPVGPPNWSTVEGGITRDSIMDSFRLLNQRD